ncbi:MAG: DUF3604 domain-containing protein [Pseudomonadales bacterium]
MKRLLKILFGLLVAVSLVALFILSVGLGYWGGPQGPGEINQAKLPDTAVEQRKQRQDDTHQQLAALAGAENPQADKQILFGDLHVHTTYSMDAYMFSLPMVTGNGMTPPADACDFARYCSALDFWSVNDHAEALSPRVWVDTVKSIQQCNAVAVDPANPDTVAFLGWEWSQGGEGESHYGHKNVVLREYKNGRIPTRPIASTDEYVMLKAMPSFAIGGMALTGGFNAYKEFAYYFNEVKAVPSCKQGVDVRDLPDDCREAAPTPAELYTKLDQWGFDSVVIPHGLGWGVTNPADADFQTQIAQHNPEKQRLLEVYSGHGNSEIYADWQRKVSNGGGNLGCPEPTDNFIPCCWRAGELIRDRCDDPVSTQCESRVKEARRLFIEAKDNAGTFVVAGAEPEEWGYCGQLLGEFMPAFDYVPKMSAQYNLALGDFSGPGAPKRFRFGMIASSDNHKARPGSAYKELDRLWMTDSKETGKSGGMTGNTKKKERLAEPQDASDIPFMKAYGKKSRKGSFYYAGGLVAVHSSGRDRDAIWEGLHGKEVYATSGDRILLWFDLLNGIDGTAPMGSEVVMGQNPRFRVKAAGAFKQIPGCPDYIEDAVNAERLQQICHGECYNPSDARKLITRIEVVRITPQLSPEEKIAPLINNAWKTIDCAPEPNGCVVEFEDTEFLQQGRETVYYVRAIQEPSPAINGDPFHCEYDTQGNCIKMNFCIGERATRDKDCLESAEERAWSSPIFIDQAKTTTET